MTALPAALPGLDARMRCAISSPALSDGLTPQDRRAEGLWILDGVIDRLRRGEYIKSPDLVIELHIVKIAFMHARDDELDALRQSAKPRKRRLSFFRRFWWAKQ